MKYNKLKDYDIIYNIKYKVFQIYNDFCTFIIINNLLKFEKKVNY